MLLSLLKLNNSYHKLYKQLDIPRTEDSPTEIKKKKKKKKQYNKQTKAIMSTPKGSQSHKAYEYWLVLLVCFLDMCFRRLVESQAIQLGSFVKNMLHPKTTVRQTNLFV